MAGRRIILTQEQLTKLCEGEDFVYFKDLATKPDLGNIYATEVTTDGGMEDEYPTPTTADDRAHTMTNDWRGSAKMAGMGSIVVHEMKKSDWTKKVMTNEESEHGNARLKGRKFGAKDGVPGKSYTATKMAISRKKAAEEKLANGNDEEKAKAMKTLQRMRNNWAGLDAAEQQYSAAKISDNLTQQSKMGPKIASSPKTSGNGQAHTPKDGIFLN